MPDDIGVRVWRHGASTQLWDMHNVCGNDVPYLAIPLDATSLARLREWIADTLIEREYVHLTPDEAADAVLAALGLDDS